MKYKVFYNPDTLELKGYSDGTIAMELPFLETDHDLTLLWNFQILPDENGDPQIFPIRNQFTDEEWDKIMKEGKL